jgi:hypothetical protein
MLQTDSFAPLGGLVGEKMINVLQVNLEPAKHYGAPQGYYRCSRSEDRAGGWDALRDNRAMNVLARQIDRWRPATWPTVRHNPLHESGDAIARERAVRARP